MKFLYDTRSFGTKSLATPELSKFQGPALYCYNNEIFKEEDWEGIQNLMRSNKKEDPLKVGRFGIGFNSVYHITGRKYFAVTTYNDQIPNHLHCLTHLGIMLAVE